MDTARPASSLTRFYSLLMRYAVSNKACEMHAQVSDIPGAISGHALRFTC